MWLLKKGKIFSYLGDFLVDLARPSGLLWFWNFGFILSISIVVQVVSGFLLALYYNDVVVNSFNSVVYLILEVEFGYKLRFFHSTGARLLFFLIYVHIGRRVWFKSYYFISVWNSGVVMFLLLIVVSFLGYVLPWGQMSFWAATVITNLLYVVPYFGEELVRWVWGGYRVRGPTLMRFFVFHYLLPFFILLIRIIHLLFLHSHGSRNPLGVRRANDKVEFHWVYRVKDVVFYLFIFLFFLVLVFIFPYMFIDEENFLFVDVIKTPEHIKPEWYFSFAYCILRRVPRKVGGVVGLVIRVMVMFIFPFIKSRFWKWRIRLRLGLVVFHYVVFFILIWLGGCVVEWPYRFLGGVFSVMYFLFFRF